MKSFSRRWGRVACLLAASAVLLLALAGCSSHHHYRDVVGSIQGHGVFESGAKTFSLRLVNPEDGSPLAGIRVSILSREYPSDLESDSNGFIQLPLLEDLEKENPRIVVHPEGRTKPKLVWFQTSSVRTGNLQAEFVTLDDKEVISTEEFHIYYCKECEGEVPVARQHLERQYEKIREITGLAPVEWGVVIIAQQDKAKNYFVLHGFPVWCYSRAQIHDGYFARHNAHEWTEQTIETNLRLAYTDVRNRFIHDGLSEYVAFRDCGLDETDIERLENLRKKGVNVINLLKEFRSLLYFRFGFLYFLWGELRPYLNYQEISKARSFGPGYPLSFVFWYNLCEEYGPGLPAEFLQELRKEKKPTADVAVRVLEEITGSRNIMDRLKRADVNAAIQVLQSLSREEQQISSPEPTKSEVVSTSVQG